VLITGPGDDVVITGDGPTQLVPGDYVAVGRVGGVAVTDEVHFTIEACSTTTTSDETTTTAETTTTTEVTTTSEETTTTSTTTQPTGSLFAFPTASFECGGAITVTNFAAANVDDVLITGPGADVVISADGRYELVPGDYIGVGRVAGVAVTDEVPFTIEACSTQTETTTSGETTPGGDVEELTPPPTDTISAPTSGSTVSTSLLLVLAGVLSLVLLAIPAAARKRR